jgi:hypothetical protein
VFHPLRVKTVSCIVDTVQLDSLSIVPSSVHVYNADQTEIEKSQFIIDYNKAYLILNENFSAKGENIHIKYEVFPYNFSKPYQHKEFSFLKETEESDDYNFYYNYQAFSDKETKKNSLNKNGSISRGISLGNNQNAVVNSNLNLQLSGKLNDDFEILASISDNNIPIQPDGNTQQLQEFDRVFIQLSNKKTTIRVGDVESQNRDGYFLRYYKKVQGAYFSTNYGDVEKTRLSSEVTAAVSKGQFTRMQISGIEGVQGPYRLSGANNESYIIILAGTERVYIDGVLLKRGLDNDYTINYNTGEVSFTTKNIITKDKRIVVEFEYTDKNYARFVVANNNQIQSEKGKMWVNLFSESDAKNQPLDQELNNVEKGVLSSVGDSIQNALVVNVDSIEFNDEMILYALTDTIINGAFYDSVFVYSTNPNLAFYRLGFSYVGEGNGNYIQDINAVNGRVYKWISPVSGISQGNYNPVIMLVTPKKKQMINVGGEYLLGKNTKTFLDIGISNNDINSFSSIDDNDNTGLAINSSIEKKINYKNNQIFINAIYEFIHEDFRPVERFRSSEFERDWNIGSDLNLDEHYIQISANLERTNLKTSGFKTEYFKQGNDYSGLKNNIHAIWETDKFSITSNASYLTSNDFSYNTMFLRHKLDVSKKLWNILIGVGEEQEINKWKAKDNDSLAGNSFNFFQYKLFIKSPDSLKTGFFSEYVVRDDYLPFQNEFKKITNSKDISLGIRDVRSANSQLKLSTTYRSLAVLDTTLSNNLPEDNLLGRIDYRFKLLKGMITSNTFYEVGTGLELKKEFSYVEVSSGQGVYNWSDYNENDVKELDEFEVAAFQDQANYIRVFLPTNIYVKTYSSQINQTFGVFPYKKWRNEKGIKKIASKFSDQLAFRFERKISEQDFEKIFNVFNSNIDDSILMNYTSSARNTFSFNKISAKFGIDQTIHSNKSKLLLVNGFDSRILNSYGLKLRWNIFSSLTFNNAVEISSKKYTSEFFPAKNYDLEIIMEEVKFSFQPDIKYRINLISNYTEKQNKIGVEKSNILEIAVETSYSLVSKGILTGKISFLNIDYTGQENSSIAYEMLEGYVSGKNLTWSLIGQYNISKSLQLDISYMARASEENSVIHNGTVQLRAFF